MGADRDHPSCDLIVDGAPDEGIAAVGEPGEWRLGAGWQCVAGVSLALRGTDRNERFIADFDGLEGSEPCGPRQRGVPVGKGQVGFTADVAFGHVVDALHAAQAGDRPDLPIEPREERWKDARRAGRGHHE